MTSAVPAPTRAYTSLGPLPPSIRAPQPMPAPLSRVALAAKQNQILALQALQAAAASASASSSSSSSSAAGSPPPSSSYIKSSSGAVYAACAKRGRKFQAFRAPSLDKAPKEALPASTTATTTKLEPLIVTSTPHWSAEGSQPLFDPNSGRRSEVYSLTNDRYPGAPGTALAKAREAQQKAIQSAKREAAKKLASKAELEHLGVKGLSKKRKSSSPYATVGGAVPAAVVVQAAVSSSSRAAQDHTAGQAMSRDSFRGRNSAKPSSEANLTVPSASRSRRPASRASSPAPTAAQSSTGRRTGTRSGSAAPVEEDSSSNGSNNRSSPTRGTSPPENSKNHHGLASTAPFQSSPLAASAITMEPLLDTDDAEQNDSKPNTSDVDTSPSAACSAATKRKASALSQVVLTDEVEAAAVSESLEEVCKRLKRDDEDAGKDGADDEATAAAAATRAIKEGPPSSVSSSRRTSPRMTSRRIVAEAA
ncbi:uncharacterized protein UDID_00196 [Ustilago sp. UG-2017a]|nr:uncharacterized protein UDID_00196 [Ustilago sp. UG-2017a]